MGLALITAYFASTLVIGWIARRRGQTANSYLNATHSLPTWIVVAAYLAANCGALEIIGLSAVADQYGAHAFHFYLIGAIPAMIFLALWMMPIYRRSGALSVPHFLEERYGPEMRIINAATSAVIAVFTAGISLYAMAQVLGVFFGISYRTSIVSCASIVLAYVLLGGLRATVYNEVFQLGVILIGLVPLAVKSALLFAHGSIGIPADKVHLWKAMPMASTSAPLDVIGTVFGLGFVLAFGYWCTDFVQMQRAFCARTEQAGRSVPLWAGFGKLLFALVVVVPGLAAAAMFPRLEGAQRFDAALPTVMKALYSPTLLMLGLLALAASLMSGLAANISAFASIATQDIYRSRLRPGKSESHYLAVGRWTMVAAMAVSLLSSYLSFLFRDLMEHLQLIFSIFGAPFWAIFLLGITTRRVGKRGAIIGLSAGIFVSVLHLIASARHLLVYGSTMNADFHAAIYAFLAAMLVGLVVPERHSYKSTPLIASLLGSRSLKTVRDERWLWLLASILLAVSIAFSTWWR